MKNTIILIHVISLLFCLIFAGCFGLHFNNRSVVHYTEQKAETNGTVNSTTNEKNPANLAAEKTNTAETAVNTSSGKSTVEKGMDKASDKTAVEKDGDK